MGLDGLAIIAAIFGSVSAAAERFVVIVKLIIPKLADPQTDAPRSNAMKNAVGDQLKNALRNERMRQLIVHGVAFIGGWLAAAFWADGGFKLDGTFTYMIGDKPHTLCVATLGLFGVAGSAFWASVVGFVSAAKDINRKEAQRSAGA